MDDRRRVRVSRWLALHLRHHPERAAVVLDGGGWAPVDALLRGAAAAGFALTADEVAEVVATGDTRRFELDQTGRRIRARHGHSVAVDLGLAPSRPPDVLYHGTVEGNVAAILTDGLLAQGRRQVHLSADVATAEAVGRRRGRPVVLVVDARGLDGNGHQLWKATDGVWLCDHVPPHFLRRR
jgi:putative RNA 2'-phosphotransferase